MANIVSYTILARDAFTRVARNVSRSTGNLRTSFTRLTSAIKPMVKGFAAATVAAAGFIGVSGFLETALKFEDAMADLSAITGATGADLQFFSDQSILLSKKFGMSASDIVEAVKLVGSAKAELLKRPKDLMKVTSDILTLTVASGLSVAEVANVATTAMNQFDLSADQSTRVVNILAAGSKLAASEVGQTGEAILAAGIAAKQAGISLEEFNALIQQTANVGEKGSTAGTALNQVLVSLTTKVADKFNPAIVGLEASLMNLEEASLSSTDALTLFGEAQKVGLPLIAKRREIERLTKELTGTNVAFEQAAIKSNTFTFKLSQLRAEIDEKLIKSFETMSEEGFLDELIEDFREFVKIITTEDIKNITVFLATVAKIVLIIIKGVSLLVGLFKNMKNTFTLDVFEHIGNLKTIIEKSLKAEVELNINAPKGMLEILKSEATSPSLQIGVNMQEQLPA